MSSAAPSWGRLFSPQGYWGQVPDPAVQAALRQHFGRWGLPLAFRVDNGNPWGNWSDLPTALALWLVGLGVLIHYNDPCCPQQNGKVERSQGTGKRWAEPDRCQSVAELQAHLDEVDQIQREGYPAVGGTSRLAAFPQLRHSGRRYTRRWEQRTWSLECVRQHLAGYVVSRVVNSGRVTLYDQRYYVGRAYNHRTLYVHFDPDDGLWIITDGEGRLVRQHPAREITRERIVQLDLHDPP
jgi:transposase InsO family protein